MEKLQSLNYEFVPVPANMTQPLDLTVNGSAKNYMKKQFITYYSGAVIFEKLATIKPLHAQWLYNFFTATRHPQQSGGIAGLLDGSVVST